MRLIWLTIKTMFKYYYDLIMENKFIIGINTIPYIIADVILYIRLYC